MKNAKVIEVDKTPDNYFIHWEGGAVMMVKHTIHRATENPLNHYEEAIGAIIEYYESKEASND